MLSISGIGKSFGGRTLHHGFAAIENQDGNQTSRPLLLHVGKPGAKIAAK